jgi:hypothetical protein
MPIVARGWESKSVEEQQASLEERKPSAKVPFDREQLERQRRREGLQMSKARLLSQLQAARNPRHRQMLDQALADINDQLSRLA